MKMGLIMMAATCALVLGCMPERQRDGGEDRLPQYDERFLYRHARAIHAAGVTSPAGQCAGVDGTATMRFVMLASDQTPIIVGGYLEGELFNLRAQHVELADSRVFSLPDQLCFGAGDCPANLVCTMASDSLGDQSRRCNVTSDISIVGEPRYVANTENNQLFGVLYENSGSLRGWLPEGVYELYPVDAEGNLIGDRDLAPLAGRATDGLVARGDLLRGLGYTWAYASASARRMDRTMNFGFWTFADSRSQVVSRLAEVHPEQSLWTSQRDLVESTVFGYREHDAIMRHRSRAAVYESINVVLEQGYNDPEHSGWDKVLVVFVDGHDDLRLTQDHTADEVIARANAADVRIFIVHLDSKLDASLLRDDFRYYENQSPCTRNDECLNFEECRPPQIFSDHLSGGVTYPTTFEQNPDARYCLPARDQNGRIGPIEDYSKIACATEGGYIYVPSAKALRNRAEWLPLVLEGLWEMDVLIAEANGENLLAGQPHKLQATMNVRFGERNLTYQFGQQGMAIYGDDGADTRAVFFTAP
jgi:hypothetical protein